MMTLHKIAGIDGPGYADYLTGAGGRDRRGDYYLGRTGRERENAGTWHGEAAPELGLSGTVRRDDLLRVWEGRDPRTGDLLVARGSTGEHVAGVDATFSAPKSVSVLWALTDLTERSAVEAAHDQAVLVALRHIEQTVPVARRRISEDEVVHEQVAGIIAARFRHHTSRITAEQHERGAVPDPQLHDHVVIANMARRAGPEAKWVAIDSRELYRVAAEAGGVYRAELAARLQQLGYGIQREGRYFEVEGVSPRLREAFSSRSQEVAAAVARFTQEHGRPPTIQERKALTVLSREPKSVDHAPAFEQWARRAEEAGSAQLPTPAPGRQAPDRWAMLAAFVTELSDPASRYFLTRDHAAVDDRTFRAAIAEAAQGLLAGTDYDWLVRRVQAAPEFVRVGGGHWSTQATVETERTVLATAQQKAAARRTPPPETVAAAIASARVPLSAEQEGAVDQLAHSGFGLLTAPAGAGKGEVLRTVAEIRKQTGHRVIAVAAAGETAQRVGREIGADLSVTVDGFTRWVANRRLILTERDAVILDDAGLLEDSRWLSLLRAIGPVTVTAAGDAAQLAPIEAGGLWSRLTAELPAAVLTENFRAREQWAKDAWTDLREGRARDALTALERRGQIVMSKTRAESREAAVAQWEADRRAGAVRGRDLDDYLLVATTSNVDVDLLNAAAQRRRLDAGELGPQWIEVTAQDNAGPVRIERFYTDDRVAFTRQVRLGGWRPRIENGATGTITALDAEALTAEIRLADRTVTLGGDQLTALRLGYAKHVYTAQSRTVDRAYVVTGGWQTGREATYVAVSRAREATHVYTDFSSLDQEVHNREAALRELAARVSESQAKVSAVGWMEGRRPGTREATPMQRTQQQAMKEAGARELGHSTQLRSEQRSQAHQQDAAAKQREQEAVALREVQAAQAREEAERQRREDETRRDHERDGGRGR
ncbi:MAG TPA: MobF family relaxase [Candidatus Angelobacter sp.]|jgi:conjugative relaxase-like TrwC/TraI family protein|nr:MobF family relaxase [Candidatus Angelobacter sp.]